jgi:hypothetical protein
LLLNFSGQVAAIWEINKNRGPLKGIAIYAAAWEPPWGQGWRMDGRGRLVYLTFCAKHVLYKNSFCIVD